MIRRHDEIPDERAALRAHIFGEGCDARLAAIPLIDNPYEIFDLQFRWWESGWQDVEFHWGKHVKNRWSFRPKPYICYFR